MLNKSNILFKLLGLVALASLSTACRQSDDLIREQEGRALGTKLYTANAVLDTSWTEESLTSQDKETESLRAILNSTGYTKPTLDVSLEEFRQEAIKGHFSLVGENVSVQHATTRLLETAPTSKVEDNALFIRGAKEGATKAQINMYCQIDEELTKANPYVSLALGGKLMGSKLAFTTEAGTSPNKLIKGIKSNEQQAGRHLPLMTDFEAFSKVFSKEAKEQVSYTPRGTLIGFCFVNKLNEAITITKISFPEANALFFEGSFDLSKTEADIRPKQAGTKVKFTGIDEALSFSVSGANASLAPVTEEAVTAKTKLPLFYVWGFPHKGQNKLKMKLSFLMGGKERQSKVISLNIPEGGFKDGGTYRIPLNIGKQTPAEPNLTPQPQDYEPTITPLYPFESKTNPKQYIVRDIKNVGRKYTYRLALPVSYSFYNKFFQSDEEVFNFWDKTEKFLNKIYNRDLGIYFKLVKDEKLIARTSTIMPDYLSQQSIINSWAYIELNKMIGKEAYDAGLWLAIGKGYNQGLASLGGVYRADSKASAVVRVLSESVIAHELGHLFGAKHTWVGDVDESLKVERGEGQSIMTHAGYSDFFSLVTIADIFSYLHFYPYATDREKKHIIDPYSLSTQFHLDYSRFISRYNIVYAEELNTSIPQIDISKIKTSYRVPTGTFFSLEVPVKNPSDNMLYGANPIKVGDTEFYTSKSNTTGRVNFQEIYSFAGGLEPGSEPTMKAGRYPFRLAVSTFDENSIPQYDTHDIEVEVVNAQPFVIKSNLGQGSVPAGKKFKLRWTADRSFFKEGSKVRISMSIDYGKTYEYILAEEVDNNGECDIVLPYINTEKINGIHEGAVNPCIIKVEEIGGIAYALTNYSPRHFGKFAGGFTLSKELTNQKVIFEHCPPSVLHLNSEDELPKSYQIKAKKKGRFSYTPVNLAYKEYDAKTLSDGRKYIIREWSTPDPFFYGRYFAYRQYIYIKK